MLVLQQGTVPRAYPQELLVRRLGNPSPRRIVVLRALQLGDMLCSVPALRALRAALPDAQITLLGLPWARAFTARFSRYLDGFIDLPGYPGFPEQPPEVHRIPQFLSFMQAQQFDLAIQMHGSGRVSNLLAALLGARQTAGFFESGDYCPDAELFLPYPDGQHEIRRLLRLMEFLGCSNAGEQLEFPLTESDRRELAAIEPARGLQAGRFVCVHPGARTAARRWTAEGFAAAADAMAAQGFRVVLTGSPGETEITGAVAARMRVPPIDLAPHPGFTLGALAELLSRARLLISNDTGVAHLAAALRVPSVIIFTASDPYRWAPLDAQTATNPCEARPPSTAFQAVNPTGELPMLREPTAWKAVLQHKIILEPVDCRPCAYEVCPIGHPCARRVRSQAVIASALHLLGRDTAQAA